MTARFLVLGFSVGAILSLVAFLSMGVGTAFYLIPNSFFWTVLASQFGAPFADSSPVLLSGLTAVFHGLVFMGITLLVDYLIINFFSRNFEVRIVSFVLASVVYAVLLLALFPITDL